MLIHSANFHLIIAHGTAAFAIHYHSSHADRMHTPFHLFLVASIPRVCIWQGRREDIFCPATGPTHQSSHKTLQREWVGAAIQHLPQGCTQHPTITVICCRLCDSYLSLLCVAKTPGTDDRLGSSFSMVNLLMTDLVTSRGSNVTLGMSS
ncbi:hypothetical protein BJV78DRAFT_792887 [Lactifluus subvellereus]|nr:hypothetical protein BJV78DRAFT_792887 [Lactifluus subvellereus]